MASKFVKQLTIFDKACRFLNLTYIIRIIYAYAGIDKNDTVSIFLKVSYKTLPLEHAIIGV